MATCRHHNWAIRLDASPLGFGKLAAHGHGDALHVSIWDGPRALVIDPGTGGYFAAKELRAKLAAWEAHNGPQPVGGFKTPRRAGTFLWMGSHASPTLCLNETGACARYVHEDHDLERSVEVDDSGVIRILDRHHGSGALRTHWHFAPGCLVSLDDSEPGLIWISRDGHRWSARFSCDSGSCDLRLGDGVASRAFGRTDTCRVLEVIAMSAIRSEWRRGAPTHS
jgi:hypothetical protein